MSKILQGLNETQLHDGAFLLTESRTYKLWESAGQKIVEAQLTADQINQIFQQVEQGATAGGGNRTMLGKGKDAAGAVKKAYDDLVSKVQNSGPIKGVDAMYDNAAEKLKQATGGDQGVMKYVQKYRDFAKEHPVAQSLIYSALIAAAGISGAGIGGAAALGLFKMVDKLLQGEKFSTAVGKGATTGAMAYGASKVGDLFRGSPQGVPTTGSDATAGAAQNTLAATRQVVEKEAMDAIKSRIANGEIAPGDTSAIRDLAYKMLDGSGMPPQAIETSVEKLITRSMGDVAKGQVTESTTLSESQIFLLIGKIVERQHKLDEGIMDTLKGAAGKAVDWAKTKGTNLTTKVTADKLLQAWKKAGSPTDSLDVASIIQKSGVPSDSIKQVYGTMKIPFAGEKGAGANTTRNIDVDPSSVAPGAPTTPTASATPNAPSADTAQATPSGSFAQLQELIGKLDPESKTKLIATLKQELSVAESQINELSNDKLGQYKKAASADATTADKAGDYKRGDKRFSGIVRATNKQFANDTKKHSQQGVAEEKCPHCSGPMFSELMINEKKDACYYKVKSRYKVWPSAYASGALVKCRNKGASNWGNGGKKNESSILEGIEQADESLHDWFNKEKWVRMDTKGNIKGPCAKEPGEGKPKCLPQAKAHSLGKKGRASAAARKRREDPNPERSGKAINVNTKKKD